MYSDFREKVKTKHFEMDDRLADQLVLKFYEDVVKIANKFKDTEKYLFNIYVYKNEKVKTPNYIITILQNDTHNFRKNLVVKD
jgi:hypothetical protein